jgi:hypothetical protein
VPPGARIPMNSYALNFEATPFPRPISV